MPIGRSALRDFAVAWRGSHPFYSIHAGEEPAFSRKQSQSMGNPDAFKRRYLRELVRAKNQWWDVRLSAEDRALGFLGWHDRGYLPHCDFPGLIQFVTFRLADSMPVPRRGEWEHLLAIEDIRERRNKLEAYLDRGIGACHLRDPRIARLCEDTLLFFHAERYQLLAWCVMPNHVHVLVKVWNWPLSKMVQSWKHHVQRRARALLAERRLPARHDTTTDSNYHRAGSRRSMAFWQREYWDTFMRDTDQQRRAIHYIESNPVKANLSRTASDWLFSSARFRDQYDRLVLPDEMR